MTTAAEKSALQAAAQTALDLANALAVGPTQAELDAVTGQLADANAQNVMLMAALEAANASAVVMQAKIDAAKARITEMTALDAAEDAKRAETLAALG